MISIGNGFLDKQNPADLISRGTTILELHKEAKWWYAPDWLQQAEKDWPDQPTLFSDEGTNDFKKEFKCINFLTHEDNRELTRGKWFKYDKDKQKEFPLIETYSEWKKLVRVTATLFRASHNFRRPGSKTKGNLTRQELVAAQQYLIKIDQERTFHKEMDEAKTNNKALLGKLVVIWDKTAELIRIDGRVRSQNLTKDEQFPIVLSKDGILATLLIRHAHAETKHGGNQLTLQYLRQKYWITGAKRLIKGIIGRCPICFKLRMKTTDQLMATLPTYRTTPTRAFINVGIDYAGPVTLKAALGKFPKMVKAWIAVFVCLTTRAIHLELVTDASTSAFIAALRRMTSQRGMVNQIISDNGTNFVGANTYLKAIIEQISADSTQLEREFNLTWTFMTPGAPHQGGIYEAAVKSVKHHLIREIGDNTLTYEEYITILKQVEACVNSRPLQPLSDDPTSLNALTPAHFLIGEQLIRIPDEGDFKEVPTNRLTRWEHVQKMIQHFWQRWQDEYLHNLINRTKWLSESRNIRVGDLVIVKEDNLAPIKWKLGRIQEVYPGTDGLVRNVAVRTATGVYKRPIVKLGVLLPHENEE